MHELCRTGGVGINVAGDVQSTLTGRTYKLKPFGYPAVPVALAHCLQVTYVYVGVERLAYSYYLAYSVAHAVSFLTHMEGDRYIGISQRFKAAYKLPGSKEALRRVAQAQRCAHGSGCKLPLQYFAKFLCLIFGRVLSAEHAGPHHAASHQHSAVHRQRYAAERAEIPCHRVGAYIREYIPYHRAQVVEQAFVALIHGCRAHAAVAVYYGGQTLAKLQLAEVIPEGRHVAVAVYIYKAGGNSPALRIYHGVRCPFGYVAYLSYFAICYGNVGLICRAACSVYDASVFYHKFIHCFSPSAILMQRAKFINALDGVWAQNMLILFKHMF